MPQSGNSEVNSCPVKQEKQTEQEAIEHVHIAIFFDGTGNNMVQKLYFDGSVLATQKKDSLDINAADAERIKMLNKNKLILHTEKLLIQHANDSVVPNPVIDGLDEVFDKHIESTNSALKEVNANINVTAQDLDKATNENKDGDGYSNIAILYSLFEKKQEESSIVIHFYIEGSGATDISNRVKLNPHGLGFGLGLTGVTALVSKAVQRVTHDISSRSGITNSTKFHFYLFGFSRGAACARLFSHLLTRGPKEKINRESEFGEFLKGKSFENGRVQLLEEYKKNVTVEFLGIYDTVVSIGFLRQKDGWHDPLRAIYSDAKNYIANWHFLNVNDYGMNISTDRSKLKNACHIGALDEFRENFAFTNIGAKVPGNALEILIPGCHSDVGGGYGEGAPEQEVILHKKTTKNNIEVNTSVSMLNPHEYIESIMYDPKTPPKDLMAILGRQPMCKEAFMELGWLDPYWNDKSLKRYVTIKGETKPCTITIAENDNIMFKHLKFKRNVKRGYSDIPLAMMTQCCVNLCNNPIFKPIPIEYDYKRLGSEMEVLGDSMVSKVTVPNGKRIWLYPGGDTRSLSYKELRLKYLHFTSVGSITHVNNPFRSGSKVFEGTGANLGNKPNFNLNGMLCRITYNGSKQALGVNDYRKGVQYLYELYSSDDQVLPVLFC